jgi:hypothetical protein
METMEVECNDFGFGYLDGLFASQDANINYRLSAVSRRISGMLKEAFQRP